MVYLDWVPIVGSLMGCVGLAGREWNKCGLPLPVVLSAWRNGGASCIEASVGSTVAPGTLGVDFAEPGYKLF